MFTNGNFIVLQALVGDTGSLVREHGTLTVDAKGFGDYVTQMDLLVQATLVERLHNAFPNAKFFGEEENARDDIRTGLGFIIDPIDGTTNFIHNFGHCAISVGVCDEGEIVAGVVYDPFADEMFAAQKGKGASLNGEPIRASGAQTLADCLVSVGTNAGRRDRADEAFARMRRLYNVCQDVRRIGAASLDLCYVACGRTDAYCEHDLKPWDYAAGALIAREAGAKVACFDRAPLPLDQNCDVAAAAAGVFDAFCNIIHSHSSGGNS